MRSLSVSEQIQTERRTAIRVEDLHITYRRPVEKKPTFKSTVKRMGRGQRVVKEIEALKGVSFEVPAGAHVAIVGETGSGKTTFCKLLTRLADPLRGRFELEGVDLREVAPASVGLAENMPG